jgi:hypothetical protein
LVSDAGFGAAGAARDRHELESGVALEAGGEWSAVGVARLTLYAAGYAAVALGLAVRVFRQREV